MSIQSNVQQLLQASSGLQTEAQANVPSGVNNGNPNSVYNWSSYIPSILRNSAGIPTGANFNLITSQPPASAPGTGWNTGYTPPFAADPFAAMLMSQLSQYRGPSASQLPGYGAGNPMIDNILRNLIGGYVSTPAPGTTAPGTTTPPTGGGTTPPGTTTPPTGGGTTTPQPGTGGVTIPGPSVGQGPSIGYSDYTASPIVGGGGSYVGNPNTGGTGGALPTVTAPYIPNYGNFDNTGTVGPIWNNDPYGNNFSTGGTGAPANQGGIVGTVTNALGIPQQGANEGWLANLGDWAAQQAGNFLGAEGWGDDIPGNQTLPDPMAIVGTAMNPVGTALQLGATTANNVANTAINNLLTPGAGGVSLDMANGSANNFGFGDVSGGWGVNDVYSPTFVNPDFSTANPSDPTIPFDIDAWLANAPASYQGDGTAPANTAPVTTQPVIRPNLGSVTDRTPAEEAAYAAQLTMESNLAAQRYGEDIGFNGSPLTPTTRQR